MCCTVQTREEDCDIACEEEDLRLGRRYVTKPNMTNPELEEKLREVACFGDIEGVKVGQGS